MSQSNTSTAPTADLRVALVQCSIYDLDVAANLRQLEERLAALVGQCDLVVFPEAITTGFSADATGYAEDWQTGSLVERLEDLSIRYGLALAGSAFVLDEGTAVNRFFLVDGHDVQYQDKRHLFSLGGEPDMVRPSRERKLLLFRGWRIMPLVCYDLRFPVWARCRQNDYDLIICVANWPRGRREVWSTLLRARAMENLAYVIGVNRVGRDATGLEYLGDSVLVNPRGEVLSACAVGEESVVVGTMDYAPLASLRAKFPVWQDADDFELKA